jgi:serine/threonine protein kinase
LKPDPHIIDPEGVPICGSITFQLHRTATYKGEEIRNHYKLQIKRIADVHPVHTDQLSNPYCEVYWKGEVEKPISTYDANGPPQPEFYEGDEDVDSPIVQKKKRKTKKIKTEVLLMKDYSVIGQTKTKSRCVEVEYSKEDDDNSYFELPPIFTTNPIPGRGPRETDVAKNGGYVAKNQIPDPPTEAIVLSTDQHKVSFNAAQASLEEIFEYREHVKYNELLAVEKNLFIETYRYMKMAEEKERCYMAREESAQRIVDWTQEKNRYGQELRVQEVYARSFQRLLESIIMPSPLLNRLRFLMGEENDGDELNYNHSTILFKLANSGDNKFKANPIIPGMHSTLSKKQKPMNNTMKLRCEDPATCQIFSVVCTPMASKQDEEDMESNALRLVGKYAPNLVKIIDFSIHQLRTYNAQGFTAIYERVAVLVMEYANGITLHQYLGKQWEQLDNDSFREILLQFAQGLDDLHQEGVIHRNLCPQEVLVQIQESSLATASYKNQSKEQNAKGHALSSKPLVRIGGYWFIENPRTVDCETSLGRADWGNRITAPPEAVGFDFRDGTRRVVTEKSDIYAFGVCVFFWATMGGHLPPEFKSTHDIELLRQYLPRKWGQWVFSLLRMCLSLYPHRRASTKELIIFLQNRMGKT